MLFFFSSKGEITFKQLAHLLNHTTEYVQKYEVFDIFRLRAGIFNF